MFKRKDFFYKKAKNEGYRSRAAYKLLEIQKNFKIFKNNSNVLDLGCAPGGWLQVTSKFVKNGKIIGVDLLDVEPVNINNVKIIKDDIFNEEIEKEFENNKFDVILSDMAPNLSGIKHADYFKSYELCLKAFSIVEKFLAPNGSFVVKIFRGKEFDDFRKNLNKYFSKVKIFKPHSSRDSSAEIYIVAKNFKNIC